MTNMIWGPIPKRNQTENEEWQFIKLLTTLQNVPIHEGEDTRMWEASKYCFFFGPRSDRAECEWAVIWKINALLGKILTMDNLSKKEADCR